jgi:hypothetical protein
MGISALFVPNLIDGSGMVSNEMAGYVISVIQNLETAISMFIEENKDILDTINPEIGHLNKYVNKPDIVFKNYFIGKTNEQWWMGYNFATEDILLHANREFVVRKLKEKLNVEIYSSMDIKMPYNGEDAIYIIVR